MEEIKKPITICKQEFMENLLALCQNTSLPAFCIKYILEDFAKAMEDLAEKEYKKDMQEYQQQLKDNIEKEE